MTCQVENCTRKVVARQCCGPHYHRLMTYGDPTAGPEIRTRVTHDPDVQCSVEGCDRPMHGHPYCKGHAQRARLTGDPGGPFPPSISWAGREKCRVEGCTKRTYVVSEQLCAAHYTRLHKYGDVEAFRGRRQARVCVTEGCDESPTGTGGSLDMCKKHYSAWRGPNEQKLRTRRHMLSQYGLSLEDWEELLRRQDHRCAICGTDNPGKTLSGRQGATWCIDHDHKTGKVRGALCHPCNRGIGHLQDSPDILRAALAYLESGTIALHADLRLAGREQALLDAGHAIEVLQHSLRDLGVRVARR